MSEVTFINQILLESIMKLESLIKGTIVVGTTFLLGEVAEETSNIVNNDLAYYALKTNEYIIRSLASIGGLLYLRESLTPSANK